MPLTVEVYRLLLEHPRMQDGCWYIINAPHHLLGTPMHISMAAMCANCGEKADSFRLRSNHAKFAKFANLSASLVWPFPRSSKIIPTHNLPTLACHNTQQTCQCGPDGTGRSHPQQLSTIYQHWYIQVHIILTHIHTCI